MTPPTPIPALPAGAYSGALVFAGIIVSACVLIVLWMFISAFVGLWEETEHEQTGDRGHRKIQKSGGNRVCHAGSLPYLAKSTKHKKHH